MESEEVIFFMPSEPKLIFLQSQGLFFFYFIVFTLFYFLFSILFNYASQYLPNFYLKRKFFLQMFLV